MIVFLLLLTTKLAPLCIFFADTVHRIVARGGRCLIPVFALGRAQELLLILNEYWAAHPELVSGCNVLFLVLRVIFFLIFIPFIFYLVYFCYCPSFLTVV